MKYRVYYSGNAYTAKTIKAENPKDAANKYFNQSPRNYDCNISVEEKGLRKNGYNKYHISEFNPNISNASQNEDLSLTKLPDVEKKFQTASGVSKYLTFIGWFNIIIAVALFIIGIFLLKGIGLGLIGIAFASFILGIFIIVLGELLQSILSIEENTRATNKLLNKFINKS